MNLLLMKLSHQITQQYFRVKKVKSKGTVKEVIEKGFFTGEDYFAIHTEHFEEQVIENFVGFIHCSEMKENVQLKMQKQPSFFTVVKSYYLLTLAIVP